MTKLLKGAASVFANGANPFEHWWLSENEVLADECMSLSDIVGAVLEWFSDQSPNMQAQVLLHGFHPELARELGSESP